MILTVLSMILVIAILIGFNALYVAGEFAAVGARKTRITQLAEGGNRLAKMILPIITDPHRLDNYIAASQVGITISSITLGIYGQQQIAPRIAPLIETLPLNFAGEAGEQVAAAGISATLVLLVLTTLQVVMGELVPKTVALQYPERVAMLTAVPMKWSADYILKPLIVVLNGSGRLLLRLLGAEGISEHAHVHSPEEIVFLVGESHRGGLIDAEERQMLRDAFRVSETTVAEVVMPRPRMVAASAAQPVGDVLRLAAESAYTRIPVYEDDIDHIIGLVHLRDLYTLHRSEPGGSLRDIVRPVPYVPETVTLVEVWRALRDANSYLAIVIDEYGGTSGMVTWEDVIEELFGELQDEFDRERAFVTPSGDGRLVVRGDMQVTRLNDMLGAALPHELSHTVGGLVIDRLERMPAVGDTVEVDGVTLRVETVDDHAVRSVSVDAPPSKPGGALSDGERAE